MSNGPMIYRAADATTTSRPAPPPRRPAPFPSAANALRRLRRRTTLALTLLVGSSSLLGCSATVAKPVAPDLPIPTSWTKASDPVSESSSPRDLRQWWQELGDATLSELVAKALVANPDLRTARARLREVRARRALAGKDYVPTVDASLSGTRSKSSGADGHTQLSAAFDASWEPDIFGATRNAVGAAQADLQATAADLDNTQVSLVAELGRNYVECRALQARITIARNSLERQAETLALTSWREQAGLTSELDVEQSRTNLEQTRAQIPSLETALAEAKHRMAVLLGQPPAALDELLASPGPIPSVPLQLVIGIPAETLRQRPDVRASERRLAAATARVGQARASLYPSFRLSGSLGLQAVTLGGLAGGETIVRSLLGSLGAPLFHRGRIRNQIEIQSAGQEQALVAYERSILTALEDVENSLVALENAGRRRVALAEAAGAAMRAAVLARQRYTAGLASYQTVLDTERTVLSVEDSLKSSEAQGASALIGLYTALGGGWGPAPSSPSPTAGGPVVTSHVTRDVPSSAAPTDKPAVDRRTPAQVDRPHGAPQAASSANASAAIDRPSLAPTADSVVIAPTQTSAPISPTAEPAPVDQTYTRE